MQYLVSVLFLSAIFFDFVQNKKTKIPNYVKLCKRNDPNLDKCIINTINDLKPYLAIGIPEMKLFPFDPLTMSQTQFKTPHLQATFTENEFHEAQNFLLKDLHLDLNENSLSMNISYEKLVQTGNYNLTGNLLAFQLNGNGTFKVNYTQIDIYTRLIGERIVKKGKEYMDFNRVDYHLKLADFKTQLDNLFADNPELTRTTNRILNENSQSLLSDFEEICRNVLREFTLASLKRIFGTFSLDEVLPKQ